VDEWIIGLMRGAERRPNNPQIHLSIFPPIH
jgi:hypothetical protein